MRLVCLKFPCAFDQMPDQASDHIFHALFEYDATTRVVDPSPAPYVFAIVADDRYDDFIAEMTGPACQAELVHSAWLDSEPPADPDDYDADDVPPGVGVTVGYLIDCDVCGETHTPPVCDPATVKRCPDCGRYPCSPHCPSQF